MAATATDTTSPSPGHREREAARRGDGHERREVVVVGSGFGGSVMAYRLAEAGLDVCLLERGKPYPPGSFPRSPYRMSHNFWDPAEGLFGLFHYWTFRDIDALVSSGLGGGSLIYANVLMRKDERWFVKEDLAAGGYEYWPITRADLEPHYDRVEAQLRPAPYPFDKPPYDETPKTRAFRVAAERLGLDWFLPNLAIRFGNDGEEPIPGELIVEERPNLHGSMRYTCRLTGECDLGCNFGSKNSLDYTYLSDAKELGAEIRTGCEVRALTVLDGGYLVEYIDYGLDTTTPAGKTERAEPRSRCIKADRVVLSAGTLGSTALLLRNRAAFPHISDRLGSRFCGNGDLLTFAIKASEQTNGRRVPRVIDPGYGPVITSAIRFADELDGGEGRGMYMEDAGFPEFVTWMLQMIDAPGVLWRWRSLLMTLIGARLRRSTNTDSSSLLAGLFGTAELSAGMLPLLVMGRDVPDGRMSLRGRSLEVDWSKRGSNEYFQRARDVSREMARALGAKFVDNPAWLLSRVITVHPLGGCPMGRDPSEGVVDDAGEVFGYPGLHVADGAVMPGPVGTNPSLTIAALADRFADRILERRTSTRWPSLRHRATTPPSSRPASSSPRR